jgi:hypothetical protein
MTNDLDEHSYFYGHSVSRDIAIIRRVPELPLAARLCQSADHHPCNPPCSDERTHRRRRSVFPVFSALPAELAPSDDRIIKIMLQRWLTRICEDPVVLKDDELRSFVESEFGVSIPFWSDYHESNTEIL